MRLYEILRNIETNLLTKYLYIMRKIYFLFLFVLIASMSGLQAETVTWNITGRTSGSGPATEIVVRTDNSSSGVWTATADTEFSSGTGSGSKYIQLGSKNDPCVDVNIALSESVIPSNANITKIEVEGSATDDASATVDAKVGGQVFGSQLIFGTTKEKLSFDGSASGDISLIVNTLNKKQLHLYSISVTYEISPATELTAPVITGVVNDGTYYGSATVSISYPELATSMTYTITKDGSAGEPVTVFSAVADLVIDEAGTYKIEATAFGEGDAQVEATPVEFTVVGNTEVASVADFLGKVASSENPDEIYEFTCPLTVAYQYDADIYVRDAEGGALLIYDKSRTYEGKYSMGDVIPAGATGKYDEYNGTYELIEATLGDATATAEIEPVEMAVDAIATTDQSKYVVLKGVTINGNNFVDAESNEIAYYNSFEVEIPTEVASYNVTGIVELFKGNAQIAPIAFEVAEVNKCAAPEFSLAEGTYNETQTLTITSSEGSTILYSINDGEFEEAASPATITLEAEATAVTYKIVAFATMDGAADSETVTKTYTIDSTAQIEDMDFATIVSEGGHKYGNGTSCYEFISGDVTVTSTKGSTDSRFWENKDVFTYRFYGGATLTVSVPAKYALTKIEFVADEGLTSMTTETGNYSAESGAKAVWTATDEVSSVTFSTTKTVILEDMIVYYKSIPAGVEGVETADAAIRANADGVVVVAADAVAEVYNAAGQLVATAAVDGESVIAVPAGFYVVRVGNTIAKVVVR